LTLGESSALNGSVHAEVGRIRFDLPEVRDGGYLWRDSRGCEDAEVLLFDLT